jgi:Abnormal spindle-like microcephaly-assoc'd, ASPM-SPD-2-Hydin
VRRLLALCVVGVAMFAGSAAAQRTSNAAEAGGSTRSVSGEIRAAATAGSSAFSFTYNFTINAPGCPLGPALTFCSQAPGTTGTPASFEITVVTGSVSAAIVLAVVPGLSADYAAGDFTLSGNTCTGSLGAGQSCSFDIAFSPTAAGLREASLTFSGVPFLNVAGTGATLIIEPPVPPVCTPSYPADNAFMYCQQALGSPSGVETFTLTSANTITGLNVTLAAISGLSSQFNAGDFTISSTSCMGTLTAAASCSIDVSFAPTVAGLRSAVLTATDSEGDSAAVYLAGHSDTGLVFSGPTSGTCVLRNYSFCNEPLGGASGTIAYSLDNVSGTQLTAVSVPKASAAGNFTVASTSCTATLAPNASCTVNVEFTPQASGLLQDTLTITDSAGDVGAANFAGTGDDYSLQLASGQQIELTIVQGGTAVFNGQVVPDSVFGRDGESIELTCPRASTMPSNTSCVISPCQPAIVPGTSTPFTITFVTSSATSVAPVPPQSTGCTSYGPPPTSLVAPGPRSRDPLGGRRFPPPRGLAILGALALFLGWLNAAKREPTGRKRLPIALAVAGFASVVLIGCHHGNSTIVGPATTVGTSTMIVTGKAVDANGNSLNTSRPMPQIVLDVVAQPTGGGGFP